MSDVSGSSKPISSSFQRLSDVAYSKLRYAIMEGQLTAGTRLTEPELSKHLGMGRTPIHDALLRLAGDGLVDSLPKAGFFVRHLTLEEIEMSYRIRAALECLAVQVACERGFSDTRLIELERQCNQHEDGIRCREPRAVCQADFQFHQAVIALPNSSRLEAAVRTSHLQFFTWSRSTPTEEYLKAHEEFVAAHKSILGQLRLRNGAEAARLLSEHINGGFRRRMERLSRSPQGAEIVRDMGIVGELARRQVEFGGES